MRFGTCQRLFERWWWYLTRLFARYYHSQNGHPPRQGVPTAPHMILDPSSCAAWRHLWMLAAIAEGRLRKLLSSQTQLKPWLAGHSWQSAQIYQKTGDALQKTHSLLNTLRIQRYQSAHLSYFFFCKAKSSQTSERFDVGNSNVPIPLVQITISRDQQQQCMHGVNWDEPLHCKKYSKHEFFDVKIMVKALVKIKVVLGVMEHTGFPVSVPEIESWSQLYHSQSPTNSYFQEYLLTRKKQA